MKQELTIPEQESNINIKIGDMFMFTEKTDNDNNKFRKFIYLGEQISSIEIPFKTTDSQLRVTKWSSLCIEGIILLLRNGEIERLPKGTTFTITQE